TATLLPTPKHSSSSTSSPPAEATGNLPPRQPAALGHSVDSSHPRSELLRRHRFQTAGSDICGPRFLGSLPRCADRSLPLLQVLRARHLPMLQEPLWKRRIGRASSHPLQIAEEG